MNAPYRCAVAHSDNRLFNYQIAAGANADTERHVYAVRAQNALTAFLNKSDYVFPNFGE